jgi:uncharacterized phage protein (TIGR02220 family)
MARPTKATVPSYLHNTSPGRTISALENRYGNDGYAVLHKTFELLGATENHFLDCQEPETWEYALSRYKVPESTAIDILDLLARLDTIDADLWNHKIIWSSNFVKNLAGVYSRREIDPYTKDEITSYCIRKHPINAIIDINNSNQDNKNPTSIITKVSKVSIDESPGKSGERKYKKGMDPESDKAIDEVIDYLNEKTGKHFRKSTEIYRKIIRARLTDEKPYSIDDLKLVINNKLPKWLNDPENDIYLRPETLFASAHIESYLNERFIIPQKTETDKRVPQTGEAPKMRDCTTYEGETTR